MNDDELETEDTFERSLERANNRRELLDICLLLIAEGDAESRMKAEHSLLSFFENQTKERIFREHHKATMRLLQLEADLRATGKGMLELARWLSERREAL